MGQFGGKITSLEINSYSQSIYWDGKKFNNLEETTMDFPLRKMPKLLFDQFFGKKKNSPKNTLPVVPFDKEAFLSPADKMKFIWYGHSAILMRINNKTIFIDPMLGKDAAPIAPFSVKRFNSVSLEIVDEIPEIDLLVISHDHYDHLDFKSIQALKPKVKQYFVALGVARHLVSWGVEASLITEFDWWQMKEFQDIQITFTPTRHFSGRGLRDRFKGLWGGWAFKTTTENILFSGDGGYGEHFKEIGQKLGPFDFSFMECGQYNELWRQIHLFPDESVKAGLDTRSKVIMPVHWGTFKLSNHHWSEPADQFMENCLNNNIPYLIPKIGELVIPSSSYVNSHWWKSL